MTTHTDPDQLRREIEQTQRGLSADVDALTEKVTPRRIMRRRIDRARRATSSMRDRIMGTASGTNPAGDRVRRTTEGNPLAAGLIAFGLGWLTASVLPPSRREQELAGQAKDVAREHVQPAVGELADQLRENLREPAKRAVESIKEDVRDAKDNIIERAT
ncbi:MAG TPA: DUF3618 domain-containing protein [Actinophytocola sp.]|uniref:DUF3618 domain-containing protein n=1 Tax=Actinophytocola sp. TaxID=1872138 RepID=UPI002DDCB46B|nr:DUF3618 domain-containing protein [Actinophytocola sp.]HEV2782738.1 DUF3618 domain-containing protein [Actinophytocola sp.]